MCQCRIIYCKNCTTLIWDVDSRGGWGLRGIWELSVLSAQFCYETKSALKIKSIKNTFHNFRFEISSSKLNKTKIRDRREIKLYRKVKNKFAIFQRESMKLWKQDMNIRKNIFKRYR